jgi:hypothetical protein
MKTLQMVRWEKDIRVINLNWSIINIDCFRELDTMDNLVEIKRNFDVSEWCLTFEFIWECNSFQLTLKDWVLSITN